MAEAHENAENPETDQRKKRSKLPVVLGILLAGLGGAGGYFAVSTGFVGESEKAPEPHEGETTLAEPLPELAYVALEPIIVSVGPSRENRHLRFTAQLEVQPQHSGEVDLLKPRIVDVLNTYLRALEPDDLSNAADMARVRSHMLRRVQLVAGEGRVRDLLIMEFVFS